MVSLKRVAGQERKPHQASVLVGQCQQVGIQTAFRLPNRLRSARLVTVTFTAARSDGVLMHLHETAVNHDDLEVQFLRQRHEHQHERAPVAHSLECLVNTVPFTEVPWQISPRRTGAENPEDALECPAEIFRFSAFVTCPAHQIRLHATPLRVADLLSRHEIRRRPDIFGLSATDAMTRCSHAASSA